MTHSTKQRLLDAGIAVLLEHGYHDLGIQALLAATATPKLTTPDSPAAMP